MINGTKSKNQSCLCIVINVLIYLFSLLKALMSMDNKTAPLTGSDITDGIDIKTWQINQEHSLVFSTWDFAGQTVYYNTHQVYFYI